MSNVLIFPLPTSGRTTLCGFLGAKTVSAKYHPNHANRGEQPERRAVPNRRQLRNRLSWQTMRGFSSDIRDAFRTLRRGGTATVIAMLSLAVGVGRNAAIFSAGYAMLAHPLPYHDADRPVMLRPINPSHGMFFPTVAPANLLDWQAQAKSFEAVAGYRWRTVDLTGGDRSERLRGLSITPEFFKVLGAPLLGETFGPNDPARRRYEIVIGRGLWRRRFGSDGKLLGKLLDVNIVNLSRAGPTPSFVDGIALADAHFPPLSADFGSGPGVASGIGDPVDFWVPELIDPAKRDTGNLDAIARLRPGIAVEQAQAEIDTISRNLAAAHPETNKGLSVRVVLATCRAAPKLNPWKPDRHQYARKSLP
jgi:putative ABC transport system permease protein